MAFESLMGVYSIYQAALAPYPYIHAITILALFFIGSRLFLYLTEKYLLVFAEKTATDLDSLIINKIKNPVSFAVMFVGFKWAVLPLALGEQLTSTYSNAVSTLIVFVIAFISVSIFDIMIETWGAKIARKTRSRIDRNLIGLFEKFARIIILLVAVIFVLGLWGIQTGPLLASFGVAGIAVAFAMQSTLGNLFGGISLIIDKSIRAGDIVELDPSTKGEIMEVGLRSTKIKTFNNEVIVVPNGKLADSKIMNYAPPDPSARLVVPFSVAYGSKIEKVKKVVLDSVKGMKGIKKEPKPMVRFIQMGDSSLNFKLYLWVEHYSERFEIKDHVNTNVYNALNKAKINIPFPQLDVHLKK